MCTMNRIITAMVLSMALGNLIAQEVLPARVSSVVSKVGCGMLINVSGMEGPLQFVIPKDGPLVVTGSPLGTMATRKKLMGEGPCFATVDRNTLDEILVR